MALVMLKMSEVAVQAGRPQCALICTPFVLQLNDPPANVFKYVVGGVPVSAVYEPVNVIVCPFASNISPTAGSPVPPEHNVVPPAVVHQGALQVAPFHVVLADAYTVAIFLYPYVFVTLSVNVALVIVLAEFI